MIINLEYYYVKWIDCSPTSCPMCKNEDTAKDPITLYYECTHCRNKEWDNYKFKVFN